MPDKKNFFDLKGTEGDSFNESPSVLVKKAPQSAIIYWIALWGALFLWGMHGPIGRFLALDRVPIVAVMSARFCIGSLVLFSFLIISRKLDLSILLQNYRKIIFLSFIGVYLNSMTFHLGMKYIPATLIMLLENLSPFFVIIMALLLDKKKPSKLEISTLIISFLGLFLIVIAKGGLAIEGREFYLGVFYEILAGITWGFYTYFSGRWLNQILKTESKTQTVKTNSHTSLQNTNVSIDKFFKIVNFLFYLFTFTALISLPKLYDFHGAEISSKHILMIIFLGIFQSGFAYLLWNFALTSFSSSKMSILFFMTVVFTLINEIIFLHFRPSLILILGSLMIIVSSITLSGVFNGLFSCFFRRDKLK